jgi:hypothetical protein
MTHPTRIQKAFWKWRLSRGSLNPSRRNILFYYDTTESFDAFVLTGVDMAEIGWLNEQAQSNDTFHTWVQIVTHIIRVNLYGPERVRFRNL